MKTPLSSRPVESLKHPAEVTGPATMAADTVWTERTEIARVSAVTERIVENMVRVREWRSQRNQDGWESCSRCESVGWCDLSNVS